MGGVRGIVNFLFDFWCRRFFILYEEVRSVFLKCFKVVCLLGVSLILVRRGWLLFVFEIFFNLLENVVLVLFEFVCCSIFLRRGIFLLVVFIFRMFFLRIFVSLEWVDCNFVRLFFGLFFVMMSRWV